LAEAPICAVSLAKTLFDAPPVPASKITLRSRASLQPQLYMTSDNAEDAATPGPTGLNVFGVTPITGTVISHNVIKDEAVDIAVNTSAVVDMHLNSLLGEQIGVDNLGAGTVNATQNWWGCSRGPGAPGCTTVAPEGTTSVSFIPFLTKPANASQLQ
jgi:hypothetical protein